VSLISTKHTFVKLRDNNRCTPEMIAYYNETKFGVDIVDQMAQKYTVKAASFRCPLQVFFNILDLAAINAWILYKEFAVEKENIRNNHPSPGTSKVTQDLPNRILQKKQNQSLKIDKFPLISDVWNRSIENNQNSYVPDMNPTVDEQLFPIKVRCKFTQYIVSLINLTSNLDSIGCQQ
ncbi:unnamed protein product, partial [Heterotrigona itama]